MSSVHTGRFAARRRFHLAAESYSLCYLTMNKPTILFSLFMAMASAAFAASNIAVTVSDSAGKVAYKGHVAAGGTFATGKLAGGDYVVQFSTDAAPAGNYALIISAGKEKVSSEAVPGTKFTKGGVAMKIKVGAGLNVTGQVASGKAADTLTGGPNAKVKIINGKRWFLVKGSTGSNLGEHWVEEGTPEARNVQGLSRDAVNRMQDRGAGALPGN